MKIAVIISTYNGEKYLREQLDSILAQSDVDLYLFVRDDGSSDATKSILAEYESEYDNIKVDYAQNVGVANSFMNALYNTPDTFDYYAFADQDDIWLKDKLSVAVGMLKETGKLLYASNQECVDKDGNSMGMRYSNDVKIHTRPEEIMTCNSVAGCTMVFTKELKTVLCDEKNRPSPELLRNRIHDVWVAMVASLYDGIVYDVNSYMLYRQHGNNVVGAKQGFIKRNKERIKKLRDEKYRCGRSKLAAEVISLFPEQAEKCALLKIAADTTKKGKKEILRHWQDFTDISSESKALFKFKVRFDLF